MERLAEDLDTMERMPLDDAHVARLRAISRKVRFAPGDWLQELGAPCDRFVYVLEGEAEAVDPVTGERMGGAVMGPGQFAGEISFLTGTNALLAIRACGEVRALSAPRAAVMDLMQELPEMSDVIVTVLAARRRKLLDSERAGLTLLGLDQDRDIRAIAAFAGRNRIPFRALGQDDPEARAIRDACGVEAPDAAVIFGRDHVVTDPTPRKVAQLFGLDLELDGREVHDVMIVGGGPGGVAAAVYAASEGLSALVVEDATIGGQAGTSSRIENYMGFPTGISGADLCWRGEVQALKFGARFAVPRRATRLTRRDDGAWCVTLDDDTEACARAVVVATGVQYRRLPLDRLEEFENSGVYYAATDVEARFCRDTDVVIVGGGNSAGQAAVFLSRTARCVHLIVREADLADSMSSYLRERLEASDAISIRTECEVAALEGDDCLSAVRLKGEGAAEDERIETRAMFVMVGAAPNTGWLDEQVACDDAGFVLTGEAAGQEGPFCTSAEGIFAVGDVRAGSVKRVASAVGEGSVVISRVWDYVARLEARNDEDESRHRAAE